jgi:hypothetical protein
MSSTINTSNLIQDGCLLKIGHGNMKNLLKRLVASPKVVVPSISMRRCA